MSTGPFDDVEKMMAALREHLAGISRVKGDSGEFDSVEPDRASLHGVMVAFIVQTLPRLHLDLKSVPGAQEMVDSLLNNGLTELTKGLGELDELCPDDARSIQELLVVAAKMRLLIDVWIHRVVGSQAYEMMAKNRPN